MTQFGRALDALNIDIICPIRARPRAGSSGRTRPCKTGRVKELRLAGHAPWPKGTPSDRQDYFGRTVNIAARVQGLVDSRLDSCNRAGRGAPEGDEFARTGMQWPVQIFFVRRRLGKTRVVVGNEPRKASIRMIGQD